MRRRTVIALDEILDNQLPIRRRGVGLCVGDFRVGEAMEVEVGRKVSERGVEVDRLLVGQIDENEAVKHPDMTAMQAMILL